MGYNYKKQERFLHDVVNKNVLWNGFLTKEKIDIYYLIEDFIDEIINSNKIDVVEYICSNDNLLYLIQLKSDMGLSLFDEMILQDKKEMLAYVLYNNDQIILSESDIIKMIPLIGKELPINLFLYDAFEYDISLLSLKVIDKLVTYGQNSLLEQLINDRLIQEKDTLRIVSNCDKELLKVFQIDSYLYSRLSLEAMDFIKDNKTLHQKDFSIIMYGLISNYSKIYTKEKIVDIASEFKKHNCFIDIDKDLLNSLLTNNIIDKESVLDLATEYIFYKKIIHSEV